MPKRAILLTAALGVFAARRLALMLGGLQVLEAQGDSSTPHSLCVVVPARNEVAGLEALLPSLETALNQLAGPAEVVLVDDGSDDGTKELIERWASDRPRCRALSLDPAGGKAAALNAGLAASSEVELVAVCDADVELAPDALSRLLGAFSDPAVGAVSGLLWPRNADDSIVSRYCALEAWQHLLVTSAGKERLGLNPPAHGCLSCYRRDALEQIDGFADGSLGEDVQATAALIAQGWRTRFDPQARVLGRVPTTVRDYVRQHLRWARGLRRAKPPAGPSRVPALVRVEGWLHAAGYLDRPLFCAALALARRNRMPKVVPAAYAGLLVSEATLALARAGQLRRAPSFVLAALGMVWLDLAVAAAGWMPAPVRQQLTWHSPGRPQHPSDMVTAPSSAQGPTAAQHPTAGRPAWPQWSHSARYGSSRVSS